MGDRDVEEGQPADPLRLCTRLPYEQGRKGAGNSSKQNTPSGGSTACTGPSLGQVREGHTTYGVWGQNSERLGDRMAKRSGMGPAAATHPVPSRGKPGGRRGLSLSFCPPGEWTTLGRTHSAHPQGPKGRHLLKENLRGQGPGLWGCGEADGAQARTSPAGRSQRWYQEAVCHIHPPRRKLRVSRLRGGSVA